MEGVGMVVCVCVEGVGMVVVVAFVYDHARDCIANSSIVVMRLPLGVLKKCHLLLGA